MVKVSPTWVRYPNLKTEHYDDFANYMASVTKYYVSQGYPVTHISQLMASSTIGITVRKEVVGQTMKWHA